MSKDLYLAKEATKLLYAFYFSTGELRHFSMRLTLHPSVCLSVCLSVRPQYS